MPKILACPLSATWTVPSGATATAERAEKAIRVESTLPLIPQLPADSFSSSVQLKKPAQLQGSEEIYSELGCVNPASWLLDGGGLSNLLYLPSGAAYHSQGFEDNNISSSPGLLGQ